MAIDGGTQLPVQSNIDAYHRHHAFTLPSPADRIISPLTGTGYVIHQKFGQGGFGDVFACVDEWGHELVAKIIRPMGDPVETEARAVSEITALAMVRSPHVVHVHDAFIYKGACYIISERCSLTLRSMMAPEYKSGIWFPSLAKAILHALHTVHVQGLAHCDVHAGNVFLGVIPDCIVPRDQSAYVFKLGDFGQARFIANMNPQGTFLTSLLPPEAIDPREFGQLDHRADVYQAGLLFLSFLTKTEVDFTIDEIVAGLPRQHAEALPQPVGQTIAKMLRRHSSFRPATALEAWRELAQVAQMQ